jgi:hypothetical protein
MARHTAFSSSTMATSLRSFTVPYTLIQGLGSQALTDLLLDMALWQSGQRPNVASFQVHFWADVLAIRPVHLEFCTTLLLSRW